MKNGKSHINLQTLAGGAFAEKISKALLEVAENIQDPNTDATAKRGITVNIKLSPSKNRQVVNTSISVSTKLAATEAIDTQMITGVNIKTGGIEIAEYDANQGQLSLFDSLQSGEESGEAETGKPLDLRNRGKKQENEPNEMVPGRDFDPETGEVYKTAARVVPINSKAAQA